jgi:20S proteasome alpha/beta subunit
LYSPVQLELIPCSTCFVQAAAVGRNAKSLLEFLEKKYTADASEKDTIRLTIQTLLEVVDAGLKNIEIGILRRDGPMEVRQTHKSLV